MALITNHAARPLKSVACSAFALNLLQMALRYSTPRSYGTTHLNEPDECPPPYTPFPTTPGPTPIRPPVFISRSVDVPRPTDMLYPTGRSSWRRPPTVISCGLVIFIVMMLIEAVTILCRSDVLAPLIDIESAARLAFRANATLAVEKGKMEHERELMRYERELWEKAREDRVPQGAFWETVWPAWDCRAYGKREYWGVLRNIPEGWSPVDACMNMPVEIKGVTVRRPYRCAFTLGSPHVHGYWIVDWDQPDCRPWYRDYHDAGCTGYRSGKRRIEAHLVGINNRREQDWRLLCHTTPLVWNLITYTSPTHCEERRWGRKVAMWETPDDSCL